MTLDNTLLFGLIGVAGTAAGGAAGFWLKARLQLNADKRIDRQLDDQQITKGYEFVIATLTTQNEKLEKERKDQISQLTTALEQVRGRELDCVKIQEGLKVQNLEAQKDIAELQSQVKALQTQVEKLQK